MKMFAGFIFPVARENNLCYFPIPAGKFLIEELFMLVRASKLIRVTLSGWLILFSILMSVAWVLAGDAKYRTLSGVIVTPKNEAVEGVSIISSSASGEVKTVSDADGNFKLSVPKEALTLRIEGKNIAVARKADWDQ